MTVSVAMAAGVTRHLWRASLMHGGIPVLVQMITAAALLYVIARGARRRWWTLWVPLAAVVGAVTGFLAHWYYGTLGLASEPPPWQMWLWVALVGSAAAMAVLGWRGASWWRRNASVFAASFCLLSFGLTINGWLGYFPTVYAAWGQLTNAPLPDQVDPHTVQTMAARGIAPPHGATVAVNTGAKASGFHHRGEWVYLPPAWFTGGHRPLAVDKPAPPLPAVLMIGGEFNTPADWMRAGDAISTLDAFAAAHGGNAPVAVFADPTGGFAVDTECVNGSRGNAADHLTADVVPAVNRLASPNRPMKWGVVGFSSGGTCALDLAVMHPDTFSAFVDIGGDIGPNAGTRAQTVDRLFGGDENKWSEFDPRTVITRHGPYQDLAGLFVVSGPVGAADGAGDKRVVGQSAAESLCGLGAADGISCKVVELPGQHDWPSAATGFAATIPWLAGRLGTPHVAATAMP